MPASVVPEGTDPASTLGPVVPRDAAPTDRGGSTPGVVLTPAMVLAVVNWVLLGLFALLAVGVVGLRGDVFLPTEILGDSAPWQSTLHDAEPAPNIYVGDTIDAIYPWASSVIDGVSSGTFPAWSPFGQGGYELAGLPNSGAYSPLSLPMWVLPGQAAMMVVKLLEIAAITLGMSLFLRRLGLPQATWPLASLVYAASGFMVAWTNWPQTRVAACIPLLLWAADRAAVHARPRDAIPLGLVFAAMALGGFPAVMFYGAYAAGAWALVRAITWHRGPGAVRGLLIFGGGGLLGAVLAAWQLVPFAVNAASVVDFDARDYAGAHLPAEAMGSVFFPNLAGGLAVGTWVGHPVELLSYIGIAVLVLVAVLPLARPRMPVQQVAIGFFGAGSVVLLAAVYLGGPALWLVQLLPTMDSSSIGRVRVIIGLFAAVLAALGLGMLLEGRCSWPLLRGDRRAALTAGARGALSIGILVAAATTSWYAWLQVPEASRVLLASEVRWGAAISAVAAVCCLAALGSRRTMIRAGLLAIVGVLVLAPATGLARQWWAPSDPVTFYPPTPTHDYLAANLGGERFEAVGRVMAPGTNQVYGLRSLGGRGFTTVQWRDLLSSVDPSYYATPTYARLTADAFDSAAASPLFDRLGLSFLVRPPGDPVAGADGGVLGAVGGSAPVADGDVITSAVSQGPVRGVSIGIDPGVAAVPGVEFTAVVVAVDSDRELARTSTWFRSVAGEVHLAVAGEDIAAGEAWRISLRVDSDSGSDVPLQVSRDGSLWLGLTRPADDRLEVAHVGDATVYRRLEAAPRVRWADRHIVETDPQRRLELLNSSALPTSTVVLDDPVGPIAEAGSVGLISERATGDGRVQRFDVRASGAGWLVVMDSLRRPGWTATVDGVRTDLVAAEHATGAVFVAAGDHTVELRYRTPGMTAGLAVTSLSGVAVVGAVLVGRRRSATVRARPGANPGGRAADPGGRMR